MPVKTVFELMGSVNFKNSFESRFQSSISSNGNGTARAMVLNILFMLLGVFSLVSIFDKNIPYDIFNQDIYNQIIKIIISFLGIVPLTLYLQNIYLSVISLNSTISKDIKKSYSKYDALFIRSKSSLKYYNKKKWKYIFVKDIAPLLIILFSLLFFFSKNVSNVDSFINFLIGDLIFIGIMSFFITSFIEKYTSTDFNVQKIIKSTNLKELEGLTYTVINSQVYYFDYEDYSICYLNEKNNSIIYLKESLSILVFWEYIAIKEYYSENKKIMEKYKNETKPTDQKELKSINELIKLYGQAVEEIETTIKLSSKQLEYIKKMG